MTTNTLTERYIAATVKSLAPTAQDDVRAELEASISDAVEARVEQGESGRMPSAPSSPSSATPGSSPPATPIDHCS